MAVDEGREGPVWWATAGRPFEGLPPSGDAALVAGFGGGVLLAVVDGLGHGGDAAIASSVAVDTLRRRPKEPLEVLLQACDRDLRSTRGAALTLVSIDSAARTLTWLGVGNVEGVLLRRSGERERLLLANGIVGYRYRSPRVSTLPLRTEDTLVLFTDGIATAFLDTLTVIREPRVVAEEGIVRFGRAEDDALVLVARYVGDAGSPG